MGSETGLTLVHSQNGRNYKMELVDLTIDPASVGADSVDKQNFTLSGAKVGDLIVPVNIPATPTNTHIAWVRVISANTIQVTIENEGTGGEDMASGVWTFLWFRLQ